MADPRATQPVTAPPAQPGTTARHVKEVAGFELISRLGEGGMGQVFKARQRSIDRLVALKVLTPKLAEDKDYVERFEREAKAAGKLSHPNIVAVIDRGEDTTGVKPIRWIAFEFIDGSSLESRIKKGRLGEREAIKVVRDIAEALRYAGEKGLIHRDVKPDNILLTSDGIPKLADLGLAKFQNDNASLTQTGIVMGTPHYMAPEQALGEKNLDIRADVYALGLVFYRCLTAELPWNADSALAILTRHINEDCPDPRALVPEISEGAVTLLRRMAARDRAVRARPEEIIQAADNLLAGTAATLIVQPGVSGAVTGALVKTGSSSRTQATLPDTAPSVAARPPAKAKTGVQNTLAFSGAVGASDAHPIQSRIALVVAFLACAAMSGMVMFVLVRHARHRAPNPTDGGGQAAVTTSASSDSPVSTDDPVKPSDPVKPADPGDKPAPQSPPVPPPVVTSEPVISREVLDTLGNLVRHASKIAVSLGDSAIDDLKAQRAARPEAQVPLDAAIRLITNVQKYVPKLASHQKGGDLEDLRGALNDIQESMGGKKTSLHDAVAVEARAWLSLANVLQDLDNYISGRSEKRPGRLAIPRQSGVFDAYGAAWEAGVLNGLLPALDAFEHGNFRDAQKKAEAAENDIGNAGLFATALETARGVVALAGAGASKEGLTPLDAYERAKDAPELKNKLYLARFRSVEFRNLDLNFAVNWTVDGRGGLASPTGKLVYARANGGALDGLHFPRVDAFHQIRIVMMRDKESIEVFHAGSRKKGEDVFTDFLAGKDLHRAVFPKAFEGEALKKNPSATVTETQDLFFTPVKDKPDEVEWDVFVDGTKAGTEVIKASDGFLLRGTHLVAKSIEFFFRRTPQR
jgi:serine/threonine protein kinase